MAFNAEVCPICLDGNGEMFSLDCNHKLHLECLKGLCTDVCPICRTLMTTLPEEVALIINENTKKRKEEIQTEEVQSFLENFPEANLTWRILRISLHLDVEREKEMAVRMLTRIGVPSEFIPEFNFNFGYFPAQRGSVFAVIINAVMALLEEFAEDSDLESSEESSD